MHWSCLSLYVHPVYCVKIWLDFFSFCLTGPKWFSWIQFFPRADHRIDGKERAPLYQSNHYTITPFHHRPLTALKLKKTGIRKALSREDKWKFLLTQPPSPTFLLPTPPSQALKADFPSGQHCPQQQNTLAGTIIGGKTIFSTIDEAWPWC